MATAIIFKEDVNMIDRTKNLHKEIKRLVESDEFFTGERQVRINEFFIFSKHYSNKRPVFKLYMHSESIKPHYRNIHELNETAFVDILDEISYRMQRTMDEYKYELINDFKANYKR